MPRKSVLQRITRRIKTQLVPRHPVEVAIAGERYTIDSRTPTRGALDDYDYRWLRELAKGRQCILDVGTNFGLIALVFARHMDPNGMLVLFEPSLQVLPIAIYNLLERGGLSSRNVHLFHSFVGKDGHTDGTHVLSLPNDMHQVSCWMRGLRDPTPTIALDGVACRYELAPDLIKVDVEGAELDVLDGSRSLATNHRPLFQVEVHSFTRTMTEAVTWLLDWAAEMDYHVWYMSEHIQLTDPRQVAHRGRCHVLLVPREQQYPELLRNIPEGRSTSKPRGF